MDISLASSLLMTHSRFADVYTLFEETAEELSSSMLKDFERDVQDIRKKLDDWKQLLTYEKEKKTFLDQNMLRG